jgi:hypothetical protein
MSRYICVNIISVLIILPFHGFPMAYTCKKAASKSDTEEKINYRKDFSQVIRLLPSVQLTFLSPPSSKSHPDIFLAPPYPLLSLFLTLILTLPLFPTFSHSLSPSSPFSLLTLTLWLTPPPHPSLPYLFPFLSSPLLLLNLIITFPFPPYSYRYSLFSIFVSSYCKFHEKYFLGQIFFSRTWNFATKKNQCQRRLKRATKEGP